MSRVNVDAQAFLDSRFAKLAYAMGWDHADHAIGKMARLWLECTLREVDELDSIDIGFAWNSDGDSSVAALLSSGLGEESGDGCVRLKGCEGRTDWLAAKRKAGKKGGKKSRRKANGKAEVDSAQSTTKADGKADPKQESNTPAPAPAPAPAQNKALAHPEAAHFDFDSVYELYPRKVGKSRGLKLCRSKVKSEAKYDTLVAAVAEMSQLWRRAGKERMKFCPQFDTWISKDRWQDAEQLGPDGEAKPKGQLTPGQLLSRLNEADLA